MGWRFKAGRLETQGGGGRKGGLVLRTAPDAAPNLPFLRRGKLRVPAAGFFRVTPWGQGVQIQVAAPLAPPKAHGIVETLRGGGGVRGVRAKRGGGGVKGGFKSNCKSGYRRLEKQLGGTFWRVQTGWGAVGGGQNRSAGLTVCPKRMAPPLNHKPQAVGGQRRCKLPHAPLVQGALWARGCHAAQMSA